MRRPDPNTAWRWLWLSLFCVGAAHAQIYKTVDQDGNIIYTDQPSQADAQPMELSPLSAIADPVPVTPRAQPGQAAEDPSQRYRISIVSPQRDQTLWGTAGNVPVQVSTRPNLQPGHRVAIYLDGEQVDEMTGGIKNIGGVDRGSHELSAAVINEAGDRLSNRPRVEFYVKQHSILLPVARPGLGHPAPRPTPARTGPGPGGG